MAADTFTIDEIEDDGSVNVTFSVDGKQQNLSNLPISDKDALYQALSDYSVAYAAGLDVEASTTALHADPAIQQGQSIEVAPTPTPEPEDDSQGDDEQAPDEG